MSARSGAIQGSQRRQRPTEVQRSDCLACHLLGSIHSLLIALSFHAVRNFELCPPSDLPISRKT